MSQDINFKEAIWILYGLRLPYRIFIGFQKYHATGTISSVEMDYEKSRRFYVIGWYHTHPGRKNVYPSIIDKSTMHSWVKSMYRSYLCGIRCKDRSKCFCYRVGGLDELKCTIVIKTIVNIKFFGSFFVAKY
jgi:hypothetical protein